MRTIVMLVGFANLYSGIYYGIDFVIDPSITSFFMGFAGLCLYAVSDYQLRNYSVLRK